MTVTPKEVVKIVKDAGSTQPARLWRGRAVVPGAPVAHDDLGRT